MNVRWYGTEGCHEEVSQCCLVYVCPSVVDSQRGLKRKMKEGYATKLEAFCEEKASNQIREGEEYERSNALFLDLGV